MFLDVLHNPFVKLLSEEDLAIPDPEGQLVVALHAIPDWTLPYLAYLTWGELLEDENLARQIIRRAKSMTIVNGELHRCSVTGMFQVESPVKKPMRSYMKFTQVIVVIMHGHHL